MSDAVTATDEGQQETLFRKAADIIEKSLEKVHIMQPILQVFWQVLHLKILENDLIPSYFSKLSIQ